MVNTESMSDENMVNMANTVTIMVGMVWWGWIVVNTEDMYTENMVNMETMSEENMANTESAVNITADITASMVGMITMASMVSTGRAKRSISMAVATTVLCWYLELLPFFLQWLYSSSVGSIECVPRMVLLQLARLLLLVVLVKS